MIFCIFFQDFFVLEYHFWLWCVLVWLYLPCIQFAIILGSINLFFIRSGKWLAIIYSNTTIRHSLSSFLCVYKYAYLKFDIAPSYIELFFSPLLYSLYFYGYFFMLSYIFFLLILCFLCLIIINYIAISSDLLLFLSSCYLAHQKLHLTYHHIV